ncbi:MAG: 1-deoxy-D-xylulose-5-phosphate reductoisomerase, partial [Alicyclobacillus sp.]|nr:1-deoxy-D-xylulose-5-phosphate reductoisomerase [Alicyclobacillus sp.]
MNELINLTILGSTGVIGRHTLEVVDSQPGAYRIVALAAGRNTEVLAAQVRRYRPQYVAVADEPARRSLLEALAGERERPEIGIGDQGLVEAARAPVEVVVNGLVGARG